MDKVISSYRRAIQIFGRNTTNTVEVIDLILVKTNELVSSVDKFLITLSKTPFQIPDKRQKKSIFQKLKGQIEFPDTETKFNEFWNQFAQEYLNCPPGLADYSEKIKTLFINELTNIKNNYLQSYRDLLAETESYDRKLNVAQQNYMKADASHKALVAKLNDLYKKSQMPNKSPDFIARAQSQFNDTRGSFNESQSAVIAALDELNKIYTEVHIIFGKALQKYETIDRTRDQAMRAMFDQILPQNDSIMESKQKATEELYNGKVRDINPEEELKPILNTFTDLLEKPSQIHPVHNPLSFSLTDVMKPEQIFDVELNYKSVKILVVPSDYNSLLSIGDWVTIINKKANMVTVIDHIRHVGGDLSLECLDMENIFDTRLTKLNSDVISSNPAEFQGMQGNDVLVLYVDGDLVCCMDQFHRCGKIAASLLE